MERKIIAFACALGFAAPAHAQEWLMSADGADLYRGTASCSLGAPVGDGSDPAIGVVQDGTGPALHLRGSGWPAEGTHRVHIVPTFAADRKPAPSVADRAPVDGTASVAIDAVGRPGLALPLKPEMIARLAGAESLAVSVDGQRPRKAALPGWKGEVPATLAQCAGKVARIDRGSGAPAVLPPRPIGSLESLYTRDDYPAAAIRGEQEGTTSVRLTVSARGRVSDCGVVRSSGSTALDSTTCGLLTRRARFIPATDDQGRETEGSFAYSLRWSLGGRLDR